MNKPYFTKFIPVDGKPKEGDMIFSNGIIGKYLKKGKKYIYLQTLDCTTWHDIDDNAKKVKLFLCSRDEQIGDIPQATVVGEISSAAVWVTDGMEFDKDEIKLSKHPECPYCGAFSNDGFCPRETECQIDKKRTVAYIKGPCTHFH